MAEPAENDVVYILLIRTNTWFSRLIHRLTGAEYTHASWSFEPGSGVLYSFARRYARFPLPAGFAEERIDRGLMGRNPNIPCALYGISISPEVRVQLIRQLQRMQRRRKRLKYSVTGPAFCLMRRPRTKRDRFFCSQFVAWILSESGAIQLSKPASLYHPMDLTRLPEARLCYHGTLIGLQETYGEADE